MARKPRLAVAQQPHLVVQRGRDQSVFRDDLDRLKYIAALREVAQVTGVAVHAYALLADRVLLLASPRAADDLGRFMQRVSQRYVPAYHRRHGGSGALWAGRFQAAALEPEGYLHRCVAMIEQAPVREGTVGLATDWAWSSARHHAGQVVSPVIVEHVAWWQTGNTPFEREAKHEIELRRLLRDDQVAELLDAARGGWPLGSAQFIAAVAVESDAPVRPGPRGRPRRVVASSSKTFRYVPI